jgi:thrombospondin type 3 repeat protein
MRLPRLLHALPAVVLGLLTVSPAHATFHLMQIEQVIGGVNGDVNAQAIQLRMRGAGQNLVAQSRVRAWDAAGLNPVLIVDMAANVAGGAAGARVLITSTAFQGYVSPVQAPNFTMTNVIPASYLAAGSLTFESDGGIIYWRLSWGGAAYTGSGALNVTNDANGDANPPFGAALPHMTLQALRFPGAAGAASTTNAADYAVTAGAAVFTNNAGASETVVGIPGCAIYPGLDLFTTPGNGSTYNDFSATPVPANFFGPGSDPFTGNVILQGLPLAPLSPLGPTDTAVKRRASVSLPNPDDNGIVPIEIVALSLVSVNPITVTYNGGSTPEQWQLGVCLSSTAPQQLGSMDIQRGSCDCAEGGTFNSTLPVLPKLVFTRTLPTPAVRTLDFGAAALPPIVFQVSGGRWLPLDPGFSLVVAPAGLSADHDCNAGTAPIANLPPTTNFFAGLRADPCVAEGCGSPVHAKRMTVEQATSAALGIVPAQPCAADADGDLVCDDADNCSLASNPSQLDTDGDGIGNACDNCELVSNVCQEDGDDNGIGDVCDVTAVGDPTGTRGVQLGAPSPNPTSGVVSYTVSLERAAHVRIGVYSLAGRLVRTVVDHELPAGQNRLTLDLRADGGGPLPSGMYYLRLVADGVRRARMFSMIR